MTTIALLWVTLMGDSVLLFATARPDVCEALAQAWIKQGKAGRCENLNQTVLLTSTNSVPNRTFPREPKP